MSRVEWDGVLLAYSTPLNFWRLRQCPSIPRFSAIEGPFWQLNDELLAATKVALDAAEALSKV